MEVNALAHVFSTHGVAGVDWTLLLGGIGLIVLALVLIFVLKRIIVNSILGVVALVVLKFVFGINLPLVPTLVVSVLFGLGGIGTMLVLYFFGLLG